MKHCFTIALLLCSLLALAGGPETEERGKSVRGVVVHAETGEPVEEAQITFTASAEFVLTDANGAFEFKHIIEGSYELSVFAYGMEPVMQRVVIAGSDLQLSFRLSPWTHALPEYNVAATRNNSFGIEPMRSVEGTAIYAGKKSEALVLDDTPASLGTNNSRQVYAKVAGLNIWESDGAGIQLGIGGRGLDPNRVSNFNTRQNGYDISADALGYPESYYSPPTEAIERIEIVRGAASLQYGTQFGGFINFKLRRGPEKKALEVVSRQTVGSYGLWSSFNSVGGTKGKFRYYTFYQYKRGNGFRPNGGFEVHTAFAGLDYNPTKKLKITFDYTHMSYLAQQPGGLTDAQFAADPYQSNRERNWFTVNWNLAAVQLSYRFSSKAELNWRTFGLHAGRDALGYLGRIDRADPGAERNLLYDRFQNWGSEFRFLQRYNLNDMPSVWLVGARVYSGHTERKQGLGNAGNGPDFEFLNPDLPEHSSYAFPSKNLALFSENIFRISPKFTVTPGIRFEHIDTRSDGWYFVRQTDLAGNILLEQTVADNRGSKRSFALLGIGGSYKPSESAELYANFSQNYRSINFNDMRVVNPNFQVDPNLKDERGFSADAGFRGSVGKLISWDVSLFLLAYSDRIGLVLSKDSLTSQTYLLRTNIADSRNYGLESFIEADILQVLRQADRAASLSVFLNASVMDAEYHNSSEAAFDGKKVELVPPILIRTGVTYKRNGLRLNAQFSHTAKHFTDATNADATPTAVFGEIPSYYVVDVAADYAWKRFTVATGVNNATDNAYFTRRASGYPGPGIIPSVGRNVYVTVGVKL